MCSHMSSDGIPSILTYEHAVNASHTKSGDGALVVGREDRDIDRNLSIYISTCDWDKTKLSRPQLRYHTLALRKVCIK
jgi:hypothetical protein